VSQSNLPGKILLVDSDAELINLIEKDLEQQGVSIQQANDANSAIYLFKNQNFDVAVINSDISGGGLTLAQRFRSDADKKRSCIGIVMMFGTQTKVEDWSLFKEIKHIEYIEKPLRVIKLISALVKAMKNRYLLMEVDDTKTLAYDAFRSTGLLQAAYNVIDNNLHAADDSTRAQIKFDLAFKNQMYDEALNIIDAQLKFDPNNLNLLNRKAKIQLAQGDKDEAIKTLELCNKQAPKNLERIEAMAKAYIDVKNPDQALEKMKEMVELNPDLADLKFNLISDLQNAGFISHGMQLAQDTETEPEEVIRYYNNKGVIFAKDGNLDKALKEYYTAVIFYPMYKENHRILFNIALAEINKKTKAGYLAARNALIKCLELTPDFEKAQKLKATLDDLIDKAA
jgi:tetratricopeptide (TPR) repeat protein